FPGTPTLYYGDELGMGDNIYLGDRNGVRTPMQWSGDRNAGFSRATPARLYSPVVMDPIFGYEAINVEAQQGDQASLLTWMRNMIALRKLFRVFGRGTLEFLNPSNRKILAYLRKYEGDQVLCVANLSRFAQPVDLDLHALEGMVPVEMLGYVEFPQITRQPYRLTLAPYGFFWLELHKATEPVSEIPREDLTESRLNLRNGWAPLFEGSARSQLESVILPDYLGKQRWFTGQSRSIESIRVLDWVAGQTVNAALCSVAVQYTNTSIETYSIFIAIAIGTKADDITASSPNAVMSTIRTSEGDGVIYDGLSDPDVHAALIAFVRDGREIATSHGSIRGVPGAIHREGEEFAMKIFRRWDAGVNPDVEITQYLTEVMHFDGIAPFAGTVEYANQDGQAIVVGMLQVRVPNEGDGWTLTVEELERYFENCAPVAFPPGHASEDAADFFDLSEQPISPFARDHVGIYLDSAAALGRRTAQMHLALASPADDPAFAPEPTTADDLQSLVTDMRKRAAGVFDVLKGNVSQLPDDLVEIAGLVLARRRQMVESFGRLEHRQIRPLRTRIHGNYALGQVLRVKSDYIIADFDGEPARSLSERRAKQSPLKDVAGMLRSFSYAAYVTLMNYTARRPEDLARLMPWARLWERSTAGAFLRAYRDTAGAAEYLPADPGDFRQVLRAYLLDKALAELLYELNNRPAWVRIPLEGILSLPV
ncbi:MAG TPA: alpha-glucosidase C-terminal domain-containing protein, partial [Bryobacteraceae bacterium]|nr:alpha-glucosidase C-terminal domain-containing protein [Bryobacteraceae bacterium]